MTVFTWIAIVLAFVSAFFVGVSAIVAHKQRTTLHSDKAEGIWTINAPEPGDRNWEAILTLGAAASAAFSAIATALAQLGV